MSEVRFVYDDSAPLQVGDRVAVQVRWFGDVNEIEPHPRWGAPTGGPIGFSAWGISFSWNADSLRFINRRREDAAPHMSQFFPREGPVYQINQRDESGRLVNDGDAQLICYGELKRGGTRGNTALCPSPDGTLLTTLIFEVIGTGGSDLKWLDRAGESSSLVDNCVIFGNDAPNHALPGIGWIDNRIEIPGDEPSEEPGASPEQLQENAIRALVEYIENNNLDPRLVELVMQLIWSFSSGD